MTDEQDKFIEADVQLMEDWLFKSEKLQQVQEAAGRFLGEFATFEGFVLQAILTELSRDPRIVEHLADLMDLENRLRLLQRLIAERDLPDHLAAELKTVCSQAKTLQEKRNEIAHGFAALVLGSPDTPMNEARAGVMRPPGKRPPVPEGGFKSQAQADQHVEHSVRSATEINGYRDRTGQLNHRARAVWLKLHAFMMERRKAE